MGPLRKPPKGWQKGKLGLLGQDDGVRKHRALPNATTRLGQAGDFQSL